MENDRSILDSIKKLLGMPTDYNPFDSDIIVHINSAFALLQQMGVGPEQGFSIQDNSTTWDEYVEDQSVKNIVKTYVFLKVRLSFDPPASPQVMTSINNQIQELECRMYTWKGGY